MSKSTEKMIIQYLDKNGPSFLGEVVKALKLSYTNGLQHINRLVVKGKIVRTFRPLQYKLSSDTD